MTEQAATLSGADRWSDAAFELARKQGLASLSARSLAAQTGGSPSAINYYFGNRDLLIFEVCARTTVACDEWRQSIAERLIDDLPPWADMAHAFTAVLQDRLGRCRKLTALLRALERETLLDHHGEARRLLRTDVEADGAFWIDLAEKFGASHGAEAWADLAAGLTSFLLSEPCCERRSAWISSAATRLQQRVARTPVSLTVGRSIEQAADVARSPAGNETAIRILQAALDLIAEKGAERLNQREVATLASVSLSSVTYFFGSKQELIAAAIAELHIRQCRILTEDKVQARSPQEIFAMLNIGNHLGDMRAMEALLTAAIHLPNLEPTVQQIRRARGIGTFVLLSSLGLTIDRLDSFVWVCAGSGRYRRSFGLAEETVRDVMDKAVTDHLSMIFAYAND